MLCTKKLECNTLYKSFWEDKDNFSAFHSVLCDSQQFMSWFDVRVWFGQTLDHMG